MKSSHTTEVQEVQNGFNTRKARVMTQHMWSPSHLCFLFFFPGIFDGFREVEVRGPYFTDVHVPHSPRQIHKARFTCQSLLTVLCLPEIQKVAALNQDETKVYTVEEAPCFLSLPLCK